MKSKLVLIFGVSQGLGYSLVEHYLSLNTQVIGVGRRNSIIHPLYTFISKDLSVPNSWNDLNNLITSDVDELVLIYNAGSLGEVNLIQSLDSHPNTLFQLNYFSWVDIVKWALNNFDHLTPKMFVSISSGAGRRGISGWAQYGSSKAALDNFMLTLWEEIKVEDKGNKVYSLSPGIMDTKMQQEIRSLAVKNFPSLNNYQDYFEKGLLRTTDSIAQSLIQFLQHPMQDKVLIGVQDLGL